MQQRYLRVFCDNKLEVHPITGSWENFHEERLEQCEDVTRMRSRLNPESIYVICDVDYNILATYINGKETGEKGMLVIDGETHFRTNRFHDIQPAPFLISTATKQGKSSFVEQTLLEWAQENRLQTWDDVNIR